ncbi:hypothetical protein [Clostridium pasteurianum]|uniref:hypothetical protein n=1 Tax=Clostridium pasteurianum TaxID=1501 RepID=UPI0003A938D4
MSDMYAITAIENVGRNLAKAVKNGNDLDAREKVAFGNTLLCLHEKSNAKSNKRFKEYYLKRRWFRPKESMEYLLL